jgi:DNA topoisomerase IA
MGRTSGRWKDGTEVQSLIFDRERFSRSQARAWATAHGFAAPAADVQTTTLRLRQRDPRQFRKGTFRTISLSDGVQAVVAVPKNPRSSDQNSDPVKELKTMAKKAKRVVKRTVKRKSSARSKPDPLAKLLQRAKKAMRKK